MSADASIARRFTVESAVPCFGGEQRVHAVLTARAGEGVDTVHLWTGDPDLAVRLVPGAAFDLSPAPDGGPARD